MGVYRELVGPIEIYLSSTAASTLFNLSRFADPNFFVLHAVLKLVEQVVFVTLVEKAI